VHVPLGHETPHPPQFPGSLEVSTQRPPHDVSPGEHPHVPPLHDMLAPHPVPSGALPVMVHAPLGQTIDATLHGSPEGHDPGTHVEVSGGGVVSGGGGDVSGGGGLVSDPGVVSTPGPSPIFVSRLASGCASKRASGSSASKMPPCPSVGPFDASLW
jgi:hypothetical protein